ncbi:MAG TPA: hypothetical protein DCR32_06390 [Opitutae bacterium]|jgi:O-antigen/teichoic acid export membrane protein|nr:hypothetical protein [Opitutae bacterium]
MLNRLLEIAHVTSKAAPLQAIILGLGFCSGLLIIHILPPEDYALYIIAYSFLTTIIVITDSGIGSAVLAEGGKVWEDSTRLGRVITTGLELRKRFSLVAIAISLPTMALFLAHHGASWKQITLIELAILPLIYIQLSTDLLGVAPSLHQRISELQNIEFKATFLRFALVLISLFTLPYVAVVIFVTGIATCYKLWNLRRISNSICDLSQPTDKVVKRNLYKVTKRMMPNAIYTCLSGTLSIWLISIFGNTESVAEVGAIERIARLLLVVMALFYLIIEPRFARLTESNPSLLRTRFLQIHFASWLVGAAIAFSIYLFPEPLVYLLGSHYENLTYEIQLRGLVMGLVFVANTTSSLASARAWIVPPVPLITGQIISQVIAIMVFDCSTTAGVILIPIFPISVIIIMRTYYSLRSIQRLKHPTTANG